MITIPTPPSGTFGSYKFAPAPKRSSLSYILVIGVSVLILAAGFYFFFYQGIGLSLETPVLPSPPALSPLDIQISQMPKFSFDVIDSSFYKSLKIYGALPIIVDSLGRTNPFIPY
ncbi:MAG: hypothetical protein Q8P06_01660 [Candidatus Azambacteria bacterium]|nr:hypothetical protein [Candidatus Azambacteria bacterium]